MIRLAVRVQRDRAELVLAELLELAPAGVEEVPGEAETVEYAVYGSPGELPALPDLKAAVGEACVEISTSEIPDDWHERWKRFHKPVLIDPPLAAPGRRPVPALHVRPPWEAPSDGRQGEVLEIVIDPGQAFGTGAHASTRLCLELLLELAATRQARGALLDVGTGSGVLAIAGALLGFQPVLALDHEAESVEAARKNALENGAEIELRRFDLREQSMPWTAAGVDQPSGRPLVMLANLLRPLLMELARTMPSAPSHLLAGGLLTREVDEVVDAFGARLGLREQERRQSGEWAAVWLRPG